MAPRPPEQPAAGPLVTVIIPTFDHVRMLELSVPAVLAQTHANLEVFVIGDGAPDATREVVDAIAATDARVRYVRFDKGERTGEPHRHHVLTHLARGEYVFYSSDDDLWLPDHVETMLATMLERDANFVSCQPAAIMPEGAADDRYVVDLALQFCHDFELAGHNRVPLSCAAHTMALYRELPHGWRTTPRGTPTDLYMWQQILAHRECRAASTPHLTVINLPDVYRRDMSAEERRAELASWTPTTDPAVQLRFVRAACAARNGLLEHARVEAELAAVRSAADTQIASLRRALDAAAAESHDRFEELTAIYASRVWRAAERVRKLVRR